MTTPIADFVRSYAARGGARFHMPGHKGASFLGCEALDITEVTGADVLYAPEGIIAESEANATDLFGSSHTFYSAEGSTLCIKAMLALAVAGRGERPWILAARNAHKTLLSAAALLRRVAMFHYNENATQNPYKKIPADANPQGFCKGMIILRTSCRYEAPLRRHTSHPRR